MVRDEVRVGSIAGGFVRVSATSLMAAWRACRSRPLGIGDFRAWLACHEMVARRGSIGEGRSPIYGADELAKLLGVSTRRARASSKRLVGAGLIEWSDSAIGFPETGLIPTVTDPVSGSICGGSGRVAIPRRMLRHLANGARPALIATALGMLLRCLSRRRSGWDGRGRVKASWIARAFDVDLRRVKAARRDLLDLSWIRIEASDQWAMNRWGKAYRIDLGWDRAEGSRLPPPAPEDRPPLPPPCLHQAPLREKDQHQEPGRGKTTGVEARGAGEQSKSLPAPNLDDVRPEDLEDTGRTLQLFDQAVNRKLVGPSEDERLKFVAAAEHARAIGKVNPCGLFAYLIRGRCWRYATQADEDAARRRLREHRRSSAPHLEGLVVPRIEGPPPPGHCERESPGGHPDRPEVRADRPEVRGRDDPRPGPPARVGTFGPDRKEEGPTMLGKLFARLGISGPS